MKRKVTAKKSAKKSRGANSRITTPKKSGTVNPVQLALSQHAFHFKDTLLRLFSEPLSSFMTIMVIAIALALPACLYLMVNNAHALTERWQTTHDISVYVDGSLAVDKLNDLKNTLQDRPDVQQVRSITSTQALESLKQEAKLDMISEAIGENPLPHTLIVSPENSVINSPDEGAITLLLQSLKELNDVSDVQLDAQWVMKLRSLINLINRGVWLLATLLALGVLLVVSNTIRLHVQQRQDEIEVKKLIGASDGFVRRPFLYLGFWYGLLGATVALLLVGFLLFALSGPAERLSSLYASSFQLHGLGIFNTIMMLILGTVLSLAGAWIAADRTLKHIEVH